MAVDEIQGSRKRVSEMISAIEAYGGNGQGRVKPSPCGADFPRFQIDKLVQRGE